jgi:hypothetical protein
MSGGKCDLLSAIVFNVTGLLVISNNLVRFAGLHWRRRFMDQLQANGVKMSV